MKEDAKAVEAMRELPAETREFLSRLSRDDLQALEEGLVLVKRVATFGAVLKWLAITVVAIVVGASTLWDGIVNIIAHIKGQ